MVNKKLKILIEFLILSVFWIWAVKRNFPTWAFCVLSVVTFQWLMFKLHKRLIAASVKLDELSKKDCSRQKKRQLNAGAA